MLLRVLAAAVFLAAGMVFAPEEIFSGPSSTMTAVKVIHLLCLATSWGATVWAIFVGGLVMFMNLPRHMMGSLRGKVFPACFQLTAACTGVSTAAFAWLHLPLQAAPAVERRQLVVLVTIVGIDLTNLLIFTPWTLKMMQERHKVERNLSIGSQSFLDGWRSNTEAARSSALLATANQRFRMAHFFSGTATLASAAGLAAHTWYLAGKLAL
ncbi:hypothetical protein PR202_ga12197 [Eleusine coracana subsp. coracana]|uniref:TMEM205-like domain-containing protein n=1 Tax=Eleusine coracana subsp. coracana TaxID=191504 RepID=A0AAV5CB10_ELECO|nr:hypothetical protein PR202_ga12197 [Eleusine coracana subsp. coracana]